MLNFRIENLRGAFDCTNVMKRKEDLISVIIPVYNVENYLEKCIESVIAQSYNYLQIILIDDGSTDQSGNICEMYKQKDSRIEVIHTVNNGVSNARNIGLTLARGEYIGFVDSDDWIDKDMYMYLHKLIIEYNADISSIESYRTNNENDIIINTNEKIVQYDRGQYIKRFFKIGSQEILYYVYNKLYKKDLFKEYDIFPVQYAIGEDVVASYRILSNADRIVSSSRVMYYYRQMSGVTANFSDKYFQLINVWEDVVTYSSQNHLEDYEFAKINLSRTYFTILSELAISGEYKNDDYSQMVAIYIGELKKRKNDLLNADIAISRKIVMECYIINYKITAFFLNHFMKRRQ